MDQKKKKKTHIHKALHFPYIFLNYCIYDNFIINAASYIDLFQILVQ